MIGGASSIWLSAYGIWYALFVQFVFRELTIPTARLAGTGYPGYRSTASAASCSTLGICKPDLPCRHDLPLLMFELLSRYLFATLNFLMLGSVGFISAYYIVTKLYGSIRVD